MKGFDNFEAVSDSLIVTEVTTISPELDNSLSDEPNLQLITKLK
jgi:hypothetical protein